MFAQVDSIVCARYPWKNTRFHGDENYPASGNLAMKMIEQLSVFQHGKYHQTILEDAKNIIIYLNLRPNLYLRQHTYIIVSLIHDSFQTSFSWSLLLANKGDTCILFRRYRNGDTDRRSSSNYVALQEVNTASWTRHLSLPKLRNKLSMVTTLLALSANHRNH